MSVDDMLWWLYETYKIVVGTRTIRRVFERKGQTGIRFRRGFKHHVPPGVTNSEPTASHTQSPTAPPPPTAAPAPPVDDEIYQSPYSAMPDLTPQNSHNQSQNHQAELTLAQALTNASYPPPPQQLQPQQHPAPLDAELEQDDGADDEETLQLQLKQIELEKREIELKLKMRRLQQGKSLSTPGRKTSAASSVNNTPSTLFKPFMPGGSAPQKRDSRSKKKIEESKRRTAERQERMLRDLERRSRRREHLTAEWVQSKDIWPLRAQAELANIMHRYGYYTFSLNNIEPFEAMYRELYQLVDLQSGDWDRNIHDEMLRERMKRKMGQLRTKMQKTGEIISRGDGFSGWQKADDYTGEQAGNILAGDDLQDAQDDGGLDPHHHTDPAMHVAHAGMQAQAGAQQQQQQPPPPPPPPDDQMHYEPVPDQQMGAQHGQPIYGNPPMMHHQQPAPYPMMDNHHPAMLPYGQMPPGHENGMVM